ncbi:MAG: YcxB family protein [Hassallia sp.]
MQIKTKTFNITPKQLRQLITLHYLKQRKILLICVGILAIINVIFAFIIDFWNIMAIYFVAIFIYLLIAPILINVKKINPQINFINRYWEIDQDFITVIYEDGSLSKMRFEHFLKATKQSEYYWLFTCPTQFHYVPIAAFESEKDISRFDLFLKGKQLIKYL